MDVIYELKQKGAHLGVEHDNFVLIRCPFPDHVDEHPSCKVQTKETEKNLEGSFYCPVCNKGGKIYKLFSLLTGISEQAYHKQFNVSARAINTKKISAWNKALCIGGHKTASSETAARELRRRGITEGTMLKYWLGWDNDAKSIMIPIRWGGKFINIRRYRPGGSPKFSNYAKGFGLHRTIYPQDQLIFDKVIICGGEIKALLVAQEMNQFGYGAISAQYGEGSWPVELNPWIKDKEVWVCCDVDKPGQEGANIICGAIRSVVKSVKNVKLPLDPLVYPKGDVNDYFTSFGSDNKDFLTLLEECPEWIDEELNSSCNEEVKEVTLRKLSGYSKPFNFKTTAYIGGIDDSAAYKIPKTVHISCTNDHELCMLCQLQRSKSYNPHDGINFQIDPRNPASISIAGVNKAQKQAAIKELVGIPESCFKCKLKIPEDWNTMRYVLLSDTDTEGDNPLVANVITDNEDLHLGEVCTVIGRADQSPINSEEVRIVTTHKPKDILTRHSLDHKADLECFRTKDDSYESLEAKINSIVMDLEKNVTYIYERKELHVLFDLCYHSLLYIPFANSIEPGWISVLIVSETGQGKSTVMRRLLNHYGYGSYIDAANTTIAGLIGGVKTVGKRQFLKWGTLPQNDKKLVCIEEYANAPVELLRAMRAARDSGVVKLDKIDKGSAKARTRTIVLSNPASILAQEIVIDGLAILEELVQRPEDLRRFDIGIWLPKMEPDTFHEDSCEPVYSDDSCHHLITWIWTMPPNKVIFEKGALDAIRNSELRSKYRNMYLIGANETNTKLARLSAALAARTFSEKDGNLIVQQRHVDWISNFLDDIYSQKEFGYVQRAYRQAAKDKDCSAELISEAIRKSQAPWPLLNFLSTYNRYGIDDFEAACGDKMSFDMVKNKLIIIGCVIPESEDKWNKAYLPTRRFKKLLPEVVSVFKDYKDSKYPDNPF